MQQLRHSPGNIGMFMLRITIEQSTEYCDLMRQRLLPDG